MAAAAIFSELSDKFAKFVCGVSSSPPPPPPDDDDDHRSNKAAELRSFLLLPPSSPERRRPRRPVDDDADDDDAEVTAAAAAASLAAEASTEHRGHEEQEAEEETSATTLPCIAFASEHGYRVFSVADMRMLDDDVRPPLPPVPGRRHVASPYGGTVLATDVCYNHPCHLADPFTGARSSPLPDLPIPFSEKEPLPVVDYYCHHRDADDPRRRARVVTDDGLAWDWSPRGVMVARGDTAFFCAHGHGGGEGERRTWTPVHRSRHGSHMSVNYRGGVFFLLERRTLETTAIDAGTLRPRGARIPAPPGVDLDDVDGAYLAPSSDDDAILLVRRRAGHGVLFTDAYCARHGGGGRRRRPPRWKPVVGIGARAVFVDGAHGFTVTAGGGGPAGAIVANRVYVILACRVTHPCGRVAVAYDVGFSDLARPERMERMKLNAGEVERMWGQPHWIIPPRDGLDRRQGSIN